MVGLNQSLRANASVESGAGHNGTVAAEDNSFDRMLNAFSFHPAYGDFGDPAAVSFRGL